MTITIFNPVGEIAPLEATVGSTTLAELGGKRVGLVFNHHPATVDIWDALQRRIRQRLLPAAVEHVEKKNISVPQPAAQIAQLAAATDYVLVGVGA